MLAEMVNAQLRQGLAGRDNSQTHKIEMLIKAQ